MSSSTPASPLGTISPTDQSGLIAIITALSMCFVLVSSSVHIYVRLSSGPWKIDDSILAAGAVLACIQSALVFFEVHEGLGKVSSLIDREHEVEIKKAYYANNILYIVILCLSKVSMGFLYLRLTRIPEHMRVIYTILGASIVWGVMSILLVCIDCSWRAGCSNAFARWLSIGVIDCLTDTALVLMSVYLIRRLQVSLRRKSTVVGAFATRLLLIPACAIRLHYLNPSTLSSNRTLDLSLVVVCTQLQLGYSIMTSSISSFKPFIAVYEKPSATSNTYYPRYAGHEANSYGSKTKHSYKLDPLSSTTDQEHQHSSSVPSPPPDNISAAPSMVPDTHDMHLATVTANDAISNGDDDERSQHSHGSQQMIIRREMGWSIHYDGDSGKDEILEKAKHFNHDEQGM